MADQRTRADRVGWRMPGYLTKLERIGIAGAADLHIRSLLDRQQFADPAGFAAALGISSASWPLFGLPWPSGLQLAQRMAVCALVPGVRILEVGCGLALASLICHRRGADVTASDRHPLTAQFLRENLRLNDLPDLPYRHGAWAATGQRATAPVDPQQAAPVHGHFGLIIGSDILYERDEGGGLSGFIDRHAARAAQVWIVDPNRGNRAAFNRRMKAQGFALHERMITEPAVAGRDAYRGRMLEYSRCR